MIRVAVVSTELRSIGYDEAAHCLEVQFQHGGIYRYLEVQGEGHRPFRLSPQLRAP